MSASESPTEVARSEDVKSEISDLKSDIPQSTVSPKPPSTTPNPAPCPDAEAIPNPQSEINQTSAIPNPHSAISPASPRPQPPRKPAISPPRDLSKREPEPWWGEPDNPWA